MNTPKPGSEYSTSQAASGALTDVGINDHFMKRLTATLTPSSSALFVLTRSPSPDRDRLLEELKGLGGKSLMTSLSHEDEARLRGKIGRLVGFSVFSNDALTCSREYLADREKPETQRLLSQASCGDAIFGLSQ